MWPLLVARAADGLWHQVTQPVPRARLLLYTPASAALSTQLPHGLPEGVQLQFPLSVADQEQTVAWQLLCHQRLEAQLDREVEGYVSLRLDEPTALGPPLLVRELPETVGSKVWRGAWLLWKVLQNSEAQSLLELGAGVGLTGLLLASEPSAQQRRVVVSETRNAYAGAEVTFQNLQHNAALNAAAIEAAGGSVQVLDLDWTEAVGRVIQANGAFGHAFDLVIGSDILYEPHLFEDLLTLMQRSARRAVLVQNTARKGTEYFKELCRLRGISLSEHDVSQLDADEVWLQQRPDSAGGVYHCWTLEFPEPTALKKSEPRWIGGEGRR
ncbi:unnamed protein product [Effrenium voratum]|uniref:Uncharacterized protein n=1 Tax=Effrenium voratum TaxID=2562239 RepID=A0AA36JG67_9DINO|nr:unnamed protein product [Effrenium voratum]